MQGQFGALAKQMEAARSGPSLTQNASEYQKQLDQIKRLRETSKDGVAGFNQLMQATNGWNVQTVKAVTSSQQLTKSLMEGKLQVGQLGQGYKQLKKTLGEVADQQAALRKASAVQWTSSTNGKSMVDIYTPTAAMATAGQRMNTYMSALKAAGQTVQDWGKNTQWAGRQITAGFAMPVAIATAGLVSLANTADKQLVRITKVMNTPQVSNDPFVQQNSDLQQYAAARASAMQTATTMAKQYGASLTDVLGLEADLSALGKSGSDLQKTTSEITRFATLGEMDYSTALQTSISLMNAYKMSTDELGDSFNYMNALENSTSLNMQDFAKAIPIASNAMAQLGVSFKDFGTLMVAGQAGGVNATQMANALKSSTGRILSPSKQTIGAFDDLKQANGKGIDIVAEVTKSQGNLMTLLENLGGKMAGQDPIKRMTAIKDLFGTYQYGKMSTVLSNILDAAANPDDPNNQVSVAIKVAKQSADKNQQIADMEIKQFQQSSSGKLKIATASMKAELTELGAPLLGVLTPVLHGLTNVVGGVKNLADGFGNLPGPVKKVMELFAGGVIATGPLMMMVGIGANFVGTIAKVAGAVGLLGKQWKILDAETAADETLQRTALQTKDKSAQATATLALQMKELVAIMEARTRAQQELSASIETTAKAEADAAGAAGRNAAAQTTAAAATTDVEAATQRVTAQAPINVKEVLAQVTAYNELAQAERQAAMDAATAAKPSMAGITGTNIGAGGYAVGKNGSTTYSSNGARYAAAMAKLEQAAAGTTGRGFTVGGYSAARDTTVGLRGPSGTQNAAQQAANWTRMIQNAQKGANLSPSNYAQAVYGGIGQTSVGLDTAKLATAGRKAGAQVITVAENSVMEGLNTVSAGAKRVTNRFAPQMSEQIVARNDGGGITGMAANGNIIRAAAADSATIATNSEKAGVAWGKVAGNMGALAMGGIMVSSMAEGSGNLLTNIMQSTLAIAMIGPVIGQMVTKVQAARAAQAAMGIEGAASTGLMSAGMARFKTVATSAFSSIASTAKWLFTTGPGLFIVLLSAAAIEIYALYEQMTKLSRAQENINKSAKTWQEILGYTSKTSLTADGTVAKGTNAYLARKSAVETLTKSNQSLVDSMSKVRNTEGGQDKLYNMALNEGLKVKVDGGTAEQARMAFDVALQSAGLGQTEIDTLDVKFNSVNLDDPQVLASQLNAQIESAMSGLSGTTSKQGGKVEHVTKFIKQLFTDEQSQLPDLLKTGYVGLSDAAKASAIAGGNAVYNSISAGLEAGDKGQVDAAVKQMTTSIDGDFTKEFGDIRSNGKNATLFKKLGISTMTQLRQALSDAAKAKSAGTASDLQKQLLGNAGDIKSSNAYKSFVDSYKAMLTSIGQAGGLSGKGLDDFVNKTINAKQVEDQFIGSMNTGAAAAKAIGDAYQTAADGASSLADAMNTDGAIATGSQYSKEMQDAYGGTIADYVQQRTAAFSKAQADAAKAIQDASDKTQKGFKDAQKTTEDYWDAQDKATTQHYKDLAKSYDDDIDAHQDAEKTKEDSINAEIKALEKEDDLRDKLFENEKTRLQRISEMESSSIDINAAINSGDLNSAARLYANNMASAQGNMLDDQQKLLDDQSKSKQDALQASIQAAQDDTEAYVKSVQAKKDALSDLEQHDHDTNAAMKQNALDTIQAQMDADTTRTAVSIQASNDRYAKDKEAIDQQVKAITAFVPQSVAQVYAQIGQIDGAYGQYGKQLTQYGQTWSEIIRTDLETNITAAANGVKSDVAWQQLGDWIQQQLDAGAAFTLNDALTYLKTGIWPGGGVGTGPVVPFTGPVVGARPNVYQNTGKVVNKAHGGSVPDMGARYTGDGTKFQEAGTVHAGEFVFPQEAVQRLGVDSLNYLAFHPTSKNNVKGYADGGLVGSVSSSAVKNAIFRAAIMKAVGEKMMQDTQTAQSMGGLNIPGIMAAANTAKTGMTWTALDQIRQQLFPGSVLTSAYRPGTSDWHGKGDAIDIGWAGNAQSGLMPIAARLASLFPNSTELIHNPNGSIKNGQVVPSSFWGAQTWGEHANHVHWAMTPEALSAAASSGMLNRLGTPAMTGGSNQAILQAAANAYGWGSGGEWNSLSQLVQKESGFRNTAQNPTSTAYGMFQFLDSTWKAYGAKTSDPGLQSKYGLQYIQQRYGDPNNAWAHEMKYNWYDNGGYLQSGGVGLNATGKPEPVFTDGQWSVMKSLVTAGSGALAIASEGGAIDSGKGNTYNVDIDMSGATLHSQIDFEQGVYNALVKLENKQGMNRTIS